MTKITKVFLLGLILTVGLFASACPQRTSIADIEANPSKYSNKSVAIAGTVKDSYGVNVPFTSIHYGVYKIDDGTGTIWVATEKSVPSKGVQIGVKGVFQDALKIGGKNYGMGIREEDRRFNGK